MKIIVINMYSYPEHFSSMHLVYDLFSFAIKCGHDVKFVAPNPVRGIRKDERKKFKTRKVENVLGIPHERLWCGTNDGQNILKRLFRMLIYQRKLVKFIKKCDCDLIYIPSNPPIFIPKKVERIARKRKIKTIFMVDDIFPDIMNKNNFIFNILKNMSKSTYINCDYLVTLSEDMKNTLIKKGIDSKKIRIHRIWPCDLIDEKEKELFDVTSMFDKSKYNVTYFGNIGKFQNVDLILDVAGKMQSCSDIHFNIVGSGREFKAIQEKKIKKNLGNVTIFPRVPERLSSFVYNNSDLNIISLNKNVINFACPSKTSSCIRSGKPCLVLCDNSEYLKHLNNKYHFFVNSSFEPSNISSQILEISKTDTSYFSSNTISVNEFDKNINLKKWSELFEEIEMSYEK